jgi:hypothetical protein
MRGCRSYTALAVLLIGLAGLGLATLQPAWADDDDWHTEADRPLVPQPNGGIDRDDAKPQVATKPTAETLYAPPGLVRSMPAFPYVVTAYQTADVARPR